MAIAYQVYQLNNFRLEIGRMKATPVDSDPEQTKQATRTNLAQLAKAHLMGNPKAEVVKPVAPQAAVDTNLKLELVGTIRDGAGGKDSALIQVKGKETKRYFVGETVEGGAILESVNEDVVSLKRGGALELLRYSKSQSDAPVDSESATPLAAREGNARSRAAAAAAAQEGTSDQSQAVEPAAVVNKEGPLRRMLSLRERLKKKQEQKDN